MGLAESMRQDWDARAQKDAFFYIASWRKDWGVGDFLKSGEEDYQRLVAPFSAGTGSRLKARRCLSWAVAPAG